MKKKRGWNLALMAGIMAFGLTACGGGASQSSKPADDSSYPEKPIVVVAPSGAGGGWDKTARSLAKVAAETKLVEQTLTVENKPGGGGAVFMAEYATQDKKDDYKLFVNSPPIIINNLKKEGNSPYGYKDTTPLAQLIKDYGVIVVPANSNYNDLKSLMEDLKANPEKITVAGGSAPGSMDHLIAVLPAFKMGIDPKKIKYVSYDGGGEALAALMGGNADVIATDVSSVGEYLKAGKVKVLAVSSPNRLTGDFKDVPTMKEQGADAEFIIWRGVFGPKEMSEDAFKFWNEKLKALSEKEEWKKELETNAWEGDYKNADEFKNYLAEQEKLIKELLTALDMLKE
jgi:putative tricarboxylic transport membrane protein